MIDGENFFDQPVKNNLSTYDKIWKIATGPGDDYKTGCLLYYNYCNKYYKMIAIDLSKQQALDAHPKAIQQINFTGNLARDPNANITIFFTVEEVKETILDFSQGTVRVLQMYFALIQYQNKMTQYNTLKVKLSNSQLNKLKLWRKNGT